MSLKQKIRQSSTEVELVGINDAMSLVLWTCHFLEAQGFKVTTMWCSRTMKVIGCWKRMVWCQAQNVHDILRSNISL